MAFLGMRGTGDWQTDERPKNWRQQMLFQWPNGDMPLTAILSKMGSERTTDPEFNWWTKSLAAQEATITGVYTNSLLDVAYSSGAVSGDVLYFKMSEAHSKEWRIGHIALLRDASDLSVDVVGVVEDRVVNGASSFIKVVLLEDDDNSSSNDLSDCDTAIISGSAQPEGSAMPDSIAYDPTKWYNFTQIMETSLSMTRTALRTKLRTYDQYKEAKREAFQLHGAEMEKNFLFGVPSERVGSNGKFIRTTLGVIPAIRGGYTGHGGAAGTVSNYVTDAASSGLTWVQGGEDWIDTNLKTIFKYGSREKLGICGDGTLMAINRLIKSGGNYEYTPKTTSYGIRVTEWRTVLGVINLMSHPLFNHHASNSNSLVILEPKDIKYKYIDDTFFKRDERLKKGQWTSKDGIDESWLTEAGLEYHFPNGWGYLYGFGSDNTA